MPAISLNLKFDYYSNYVIVRVIFLQKLVSVSPNITIVLFIKDEFFRRCCLMAAQQVVLSLKEESRGHYLFLVVNNSSRQIKNLLEIQVYS